MELKLTRRHTSALLDVADSPLLLANRAKRPFVQEDGFWQLCAPIVAVQVPGPRSQKPPFIQLTELLNGLLRD